MPSVVCDFVLGAEGAGRDRAQTSVDLSLVHLARAPASDTVSDARGALWTTGINPADPPMIERLAKLLSIPLERLGDARVKDELRDNTERAVQSGVFGVPSLQIGEEVFWGSDAIEFATAYLKNPGILDEEMRHADTLPIGASRPAASLPP